MGSSIGKGFVCLCFYQSRAKVVESPLIIFSLFFSSVHWYLFPTLTGNKHELFLDVAVTFPSTLCPPPYVGNLRSTVIYVREVVPFFVWN